MGTVTYVVHDGETHSIDLEDGFSIMEGAVRNGIAGIDADCGGQCACATCHVRVDPGWMNATGAPNEAEDEMLSLVNERDERSRLSCQIVMSPALTGLIVHLPESQH